ncbi:hypothetical protein A9Q94_02085 [Rhodobacterales bacterium 56_14_T64]|nr:hypothetical protein A9Q94_02085 [Rhodobacterales bacterium 56_14_T64]
MTLIGIVFLVLMVVDSPFAIGLSGFSFFLTSDIIPTSIRVQKITTVSQSFPLLAVSWIAGG